MPFTPRLFLWVGLSLFPALLIMEFHGSFLGKLAICIIREVGCSKAGEYSLAPEWSS